MNTTEDHRYSTFALDVYWYAGEGDPELVAHVAACTPCRAYLDHLSALEAPARGAPAREVLVTKLRRVARGRWTARAIGALALAAGLAIGAKSVLVHHEAEPYVGVKGTPSVQVLVRRSGTTTVWNGTSPVEAGDALAFQVECEGLSRATVAARDARTGKFQRVADAVCPADRLPLPFTLLVDDDPNDDEVAVVLSRLPLDDTMLVETIARETRAHDRWATRLIFHKSQGGSP